MRRKIIAGNWKMNGNCADATQLIQELKPLVAHRNDVETLVCPPYTALVAAREALAGSHIGLGAQNLFWKPRGAYTGQISAEMLIKLNVRYVIVGHSEMRGRFGVPIPDFDEELLRYFGDTDSSVNRKLHAALENGLIPICCVGETFEERRAGATEAIIIRQTERALAGITAEDALRIVFAYEPVWAIGTGAVCEAGEADRVCHVIRDVVLRLYGPEVAEQVRIQYGGSVKPDNAAELLIQPNIDGALVGGASLKAADFAAIVNACPRSSE
jgi:triosephosphate isomerase